VRWTCSAPSGHWCATSAADGRAHRQVLGDGAMLVGVETEPVVAALLEMQLRAESDASSMAIRCGITVGQVILHEGDDYIGHDVNLAARLCELAKGGEVMGAMAVAEHLPKWATVVGYDQIAVRGLDAPERVVRLGSPSWWPRARRTRSAASPHPRGGRQLRRRPLGQRLLFCSPSCADTWQRRPAPPPRAREPPGPAHGTVSRVRRAVPTGVRPPAPGKLAPAPRLTIRPAASPCYETQPETDRRVHRRGRAGCGHRLLLRVKGTIIGVAVGSIIATTGTAVAANTIDRTNKRVARSSSGTRTSRGSSRDSGPRRPSARLSPRHQRAKG